MTQRRIFVLDTNVLMHDPASLYRFEEHDLYLPMVVLEELDAAKKGTSEVSRNARQVSRMLDDIVSQADRAQMTDGLPLSGGRPPGLQTPVDGSAGAEPARSGRIFFQTRPAATALPDLLPGNKPDNSILVCALSLATEYPETAVTLVSKDINLRIKAAVVGSARAEYEYAIPVGEACELLETLCVGRLEKIRHYIERDGIVWEVDEFTGDNAGLIVAEVELSAVDQAFVRPQWLGRELTDDRRYYNHHLALHPYRSWDADAH